MYLRNPLIQNEIADILGQVKFFNGAPNLAKYLKEVLVQKDLLNDGEGRIHFEDSARLVEKEKRFFEILKEILGTEEKIMD